MGFEAHTKNTVGTLEKSGYKRSYIGDDAHHFDLDLSVGTSSDSVVEGVNFWKDRGAKIIEQELINPGKMAAEIDTMILAGKNREDVKNYLFQRSIEYGLSQSRVDLFREFLDTEFTRMELAKKCAEQAKGREDDFYKEIFGVVPMGLIEIKNNPYLCIVCDSREDYAFIKSYIEGQKPSASAYGDMLDASFNERGMAIRTDLSVAASGKSGMAVRRLMQEIPGGRLMVLNRKAIIKSEASVEKVVLHENQHLSDNAIEETVGKNKGFGRSRENHGSGLNNIFSLEAEKRRIFELINERTMMAEQSTGMEVLAYFKDRSLGLEKMKEAFAKQGGEYNFFNRYNSDVPKGFISRILHRKVYKKFLAEQEREFCRHIEDGLKAVSDFESAGYPRELIIGILRFKPISEWKEIFARVHKFTSKKSSLAA